MSFASNAAGLLEQLSKSCCNANGSVPEKHHWRSQVVTPFSMLSGCAQGIISIFWWAVIDKQAGETYSQVRH